MTTVLVTSEKTRPSESLPIKRMGTCLEIRPLRRTFWEIILTTWGRGQEFRRFHDSRGGKRRWENSSACCEKSTVNGAIEQARTANQVQKTQSRRGTTKKKKQ